MKTFFTVTIVTSGMKWVMRQMGGVHTVCPEDSTRWVQSAQLGAWIPLRGDRHLASGS